MLMRKQTTVLNAEANRNDFIRDLFAKYGQAPKDYEVDIDNGILRAKKAANAK